MRVGHRLLGRRIKQAGFRDTGYELATARFIERREDELKVGLVAVAAMAWG